MHEYVAGGQTSSRALTLKSWKSQGVTSLEGSGLRGLELAGEQPWPSVLLVCTELCRAFRDCDEVEWSLPVVRMLVSELLDESSPSSPKKAPSLLFGLPRLVLTRETGIEFWLLTVVALAMDGLLSLLQNMGSATSFSCEGFLGRSSYKVPLSALPLEVEGSALNQGAI